MPLLEGGAVAKIDEHTVLTVYKVDRLLGAEGRARFAALVGNQQSDRSDQRSHEYPLLRGNFQKEFHAYLAGEFLLWPTTAAVIKQAGR
jgi:hypothetical protein